MINLVGIEKHFGEELKRFGMDVLARGYPDAGNGKYAEKLSLKDWIAFNTDQYVGNISVQSIVAHIFVTLVVGLHSPTSGIAYGLFMWFFRLAYHFVAKSNPSTIAIFEPLNQAFLFGGAAWAGVVAYSSGSK